MIAKGKKVLYRDEIWSLAQDDISGDIVKIQKDNGEEFYVNKNEVYNLVNINVDYCSEGNYILVGEDTGIITNIQGENITVIIKSEYHTIKKHKIKKCSTKGSLLSKLENENKNNNIFKVGDMVLYNNTPHKIFSINNDNVVLEIIYSKKTFRTTINKITKLEKIIPISIKKDDYVILNSNNILKVINVSGNGIVSLTNSTVVNINQINDVYRPTENTQKTELDIKYVYSKTHNSLCTPILDKYNNISYKSLNNNRIIPRDTELYDVVKKYKTDVRIGDLVLDGCNTSRVDSFDIDIISELPGTCEFYSIGSIIKNNNNTNKNSFKKEDVVLYDNTPYIVFEVVNKDRVILMDVINGVKFNVVNSTKTIVKLNKVSKDYKNIEAIETKNNGLYGVISILKNNDIIVKNNDIIVKNNGNRYIISSKTIKNYYTADNIDISTEPIEVIEKTQQKQDTQDTNKNKFISLRTVTWKNPKPKIKNTKPLELNQYILVDGLELGYKVSCIIDDKIEIQKNETKKYINKEDVYPLYKTGDNEAKSIRVGNIVLLEKGIFGIITKVLDDNLYRIKDLKEPIEIDEIQEVYTTKKPKINAVKYSCGKVLYKGQTYNEKDLENMFKGSKFIYEEIQNTYNDTLIAKEYNVSLDRIKPKEKSIYNKLKTVLYHPLSIQNKRWACLLGESGTGKTQIAVELAKNMGKEYVLYQGNAQVTVDDLKGYRSITTGKYFGSLLRDAVENGKIFILDEIDACNPNTLIALNSLKRDTYQFEDKEVKVHEDFRLIATANSLEMSEEYNARIPMDKATKARFKIIEYNMEAVDLAVRYGLEYIKKIPNIDRLTTREIEDMVIDMKIQEQIEQNNTEGWEV